MAKPKKKMFTILETIEFAARLHAGQVRKITGEPYICHVLRVAQYVEAYIPDYTENDLLVAILHDTLEDTEVLKDEIIAHFTWGVYENVFWLTNPPRNGMKRAEYKKVINQRLTGCPDKVQQIKLCDRLDNIKCRNTDSLTTDQQRWILKYASETEDLLEAIGDCNEKLCTAIRDEVASIRKALKKDKVST